MYFNIKQDNNSDVIAVTIEWQSSTQTYVTFTYTHVASAQIIVAQLLPAPVDADQIGAFSSAVKQVLKRLMG